MIFLQNQALAAPMLVLCMCFDKRYWRGIPWCIMAHVWLGELDCLPLSMF
jgi:hypothetical protein